MWDSFPTVSLGLETLRHLPLCICHTLYLIQMPVGLISNQAPYQIAVKKTRLSSSPRSSPCYLAMPSSTTQLPPEPSPTLMTDEKDWSLERLWLTREPGGRFEGRLCQASAAVEQALPFSPELSPSLT